MGSLAGFRLMADVKTLACNGSYQGSNVNPVETRQSRAAAEYTRRAKDIDANLGTPAGEEGPMTAEMKTYGSPPGQVLAPVVGAFGEISSGMYAFADVIAAAKTSDHLQFFNGSAEEFHGLFRQWLIRD